MVELTSQIRHPHATPAQVAERMRSDAYLSALCDALDMVSAIEVTHTQTSGARLERTTRYTAPTAGKIPGFLKKYEDRAPAHVHWEERGVWDLNTHTLSYTIAPDIPPHWNKHLHNEGTLTLTADGDDTIMRVHVSYAVKLFGLGAVIERALKPEVQRILDLQGQVAATL